MLEHQLRNLVTVWQMRGDIEDRSGGFRSHPLVLRRHELDDVVVDYSVLSVSMPLAAGQKHTTEVDEMLQPLAELCEQHREQMAEWQWDYDWYYFELLDRDARVRPLCWIDPWLLYKHFPEDPDTATRTITSVQELMLSSYRRQLMLIDWVANTPVTSEDERLRREQWREWLIATWRDNEKEWLNEGLLVYGSVEPWSRMLEFHPDAVGSDQADDDQLPEQDLQSSPASGYASTGCPGLQWRMIPLYDHRHLSLIWEAMKQDLFVTSVFNFAARPRQDPRVWENLEKRFVLPFERVSRRTYLARLREQKVLDWSRQGKTLDEMAQLLIDGKLCCLDEAEAERISELPPNMKYGYYFESARAAVVRIRRRLWEDGLIEKRNPGRPPRKA